MAMFHGKDGNVTWNNGITTLTYIQSWSLEAHADTAEATAMQDDWKEYLPGFSVWTATVECNAVEAGPQLPFATAASVSGLGEDDTTLQAADEQQLVLYLEYDLANTNYKSLDGDAILIGIAHSVDKDDIGKLTYTFQGVTALVYTSGVNPI